MRPALEIVINGERGAEWERAVGTNRFPTLDRDPIPAELPGHPNTLVHRVDMSAIEPELLDRICEHLARKFNTAADQVRETLLRDGLPIRAENCTVVLNDPQRWVG